MEVEVMVEVTEEDMEVDMVDMEEVTEDIRVEDHREDGGGHGRFGPLRFGPFRFGPLRFGPLRFGHGTMIPIF